MTQEETIRGNKLIAEFMGAEVKNETYCFHFGNPAYEIQIEEMSFESVKRLRYQSSWDWLMPVVEKIESLWISGEQSSVTIRRNFVEIVHEVGYNNIDYAKNSNLRKDNELGGAFHTNNYTKIENTYKMVIEFIKWYNTQKL